MKLSDLAREPQLVKIVLDDEETTKEYGEAIEFWTWDRQPMDVFMRLAAQQADTTQAGIFETVRTLVLDESGQPILENNRSLPVGIMMRVLTKVVENLGK